MNRTRQILKKAVVTAMGASLVVSGSSTVFAAGSYQETEKTALANVVSKLPEAWNGYLENYQKACEGTKSTFTLTVEDTGRALAGALMGGTDVSWLQSFTFDSDITIKDGVEAIAGGLLLNDTKLCDLNFYMDLANMVEYIQIPELSDGYIPAPIEGTVTTSEGVAENSQEIMSTYMNALSDLSSALPDSDTLGTLLDRYGNIIIDNIEDGSSVEESVSVDGISEDCTVYEGTVSEKAVTAMAEGILTAAKDDAEIKGLFEQWAGASDGEDQYQQFEDAVFLRGQSYQISHEIHGLCIVIHLYIARLEYVVFLRCCSKLHIPSQLRLYSCQQLYRIERLSDIIIRTYIQTKYLVCIFTFCCKENDRDIASLPHLCKHLYPVHFRHHYVQKNKMDVILTYELNSLSAVICLVQIIVISRKIYFQRRNNIFFIITYQYVVHILSTSFIIMP